MILSIAWKSSPPEILIFNDDSNDRRPFMEWCKGKITPLARQKASILVSPFADASFRERLEDSCQRLTNVSFGCSGEILGCQFQCVVVILDCASCWFPITHLLDSLTRATTSLHLLVNTSLEPVYINDLLSYRLEVCQPHDVESLVEECLLVEEYWIIQSVDS